MPNGSADMALDRIVVVTGMAGAGRTTALRALEDLGYEAVDNLPVSLLGSLLRPLDHRERRLAIGIDSRSRHFDPGALLKRLERAGEMGNADIRVLFLDCDDDVLARRFTETRRRHPLAPDRAVADGIAQERGLIAPLRESADLVIDTSHLAPGELRQLTSAHFAVGSDDRLVISVLSFSYRKGLPREADLVFDVRFLSNPHYDVRLRPMTGIDQPVQNYIDADPKFRKLLRDLEEFLVPLLPAYQLEGKSYLTIAFGCTGGRHRSIATAELFAERLRLAGWPAHVRHRDTPEANVRAEEKSAPGTPSQPSVRRQ
ncbi:MAG: RNase adapter RapZ [Rhizobiales bacterium]|nr:RNase adapter RapZ [Hyphomicrobiales bacterium]